MHPGQLAAWNLETRIVIVLAGSQGGKTAWAPWWLAREIERRGPGDYLAATASYKLFDVSFLPNMVRVFVDLLGVGRYRASGPAIEWPDGRTRILLRSAAAGPNTFESMTAKAAVFDEAGMTEFTRAHYEAAQARLVVNEGRLLLCSTPYAFNWFKDLCDAGMAGDPTIGIVQFPSTLNPAIPAAEVERLRGTMQDWRFDMRYLAQFSRPPNLIYGCIGDEHWVAPFDVPYNWQVVVGVDPSGGHCATLWLAHKPNTDQWFAFRETFEQGLTTIEHVRKARASTLRGQQATFVGGGPSEDQERRDWAWHGLDLLKPPVTDVDAGIDRVVGMVKSGRLFFFKSLTETRREFDAYRRKLDEGTGEVLTDIIDKSRYHSLDCLRAAASYIEEPSDVGRQLEDYFNAIRS